jgi:hypothetical protein
MNDNINKIENSSTNFFVSKYSAKEIEALLDKIANYDVLTYEEIQLLRNKGIENLSTFDGNYNSLTNTPEIPSKLSDLDPDLGSEESYIKNTEAEELVREVFRAAGFQPSSDKLSQYVNDADFITAQEVNNMVAGIRITMNQLKIPTKYSDLHNDKGFISEYIIDDKIQVINDRMNNLDSLVDSEITYLKNETTKIYNNVLDLNDVSHDHANKAILDEIKRSEPSIHVGNEPPIDPLTIWIDTNDSYLSDPMFDDIYENNIITQLTLMIETLGEKVASLQSELSILQSRIESGEFGKPDDDKPVEKPDSRYNTFIFENGDMAVSEDGDKFIIEDNTKI